MIGTLLTFFAVGLATLLAAGILLWIVGVVFSITFGLAAFLLFKVAPILLVGWIAVKLFERYRASPDGLSAADRRWLDGGE